MSRSTGDSNGLLAIEQKLKNAINLSSNNNLLRTELEQAQILLKNETARIATEVLRTSKQIDDDFQEETINDLQFLSDLPSQRDRQNIKNGAFAAVQTGLFLGNSNSSLIPGDPGSEIHRSAAKRIYKIPLPDLTKSSKTVSEQTKAELFKTRPCVEPETRDRLEQGILRLIERRLIPPAAHLTIEPPAFEQTQIDLMQRGSEKFERAVHLQDNMQFLVYKLDNKDKNLGNPNKMKNSPGKTVGKISKKPTKNEKISEISEKTKKPEKVENTSKSQEKNNKVAIPTHSVPQNSRIQSAIQKPELMAPPATREIALRPGKDNKIAAVALNSTAGMILKEQSSYKPQFEMSITDNDPLEMCGDTVSLEQNQRYQRTVLPHNNMTTRLKFDLKASKKIYRRLSALAYKYSLPKVVVDSEQLLALASTNLLSSHLLSNKYLIQRCVVNAVEVLTLVSIPGRVFKHPNRELVLQSAATYIQSQFRSFYHHKQYRIYRKKRWAAGVIAISWIMYVRMAKMKRRLVTSRQRQIQAHNSKVAGLMTKGSWKKISRNSCVIHIPSLGYPNKIRLSMTDLKIRQACQWGRIFDIFDQNVEKIIMILPLEMSVEIINYYKTIIAIKNIGDFQKIHFIAPEAMNSFPTHNMALSTLLKYSPDAINEIKAIIAPYQKNCYINCTKPCLDDLSLSEILDVPLLAPKWETLQSMNSKSNIIDMLKEVENLDIPPSDTNLHSLDEIALHLGDLVVKHPSQKVWLFKVNHNVDGRGIMRLILNQETLPCYDWFQAQVTKFGEQWKFPWAHESALNRLLRELKQVIKEHSICMFNDMIKSEKMYPNWEDFAKDVNNYGCIVQAEALDADKLQVTAISTDIFIKPGNKKMRYKILCTGDQIHAGDHLQHWGSTVPQSSLEEEELEAKITKIVEMLWGKRIFGHVTISFLTFFNENDEQITWAFDIKLGLSDQLAFYNIGKHLAFQNGDVWDAEGLSMSLCPRMIHTNLSCVHYSVLFQMLRAYAVGWDAKYHQGCLLALMDPLQRDNLGIISISRDGLAKSLSGLARAMAVIAKEISSPSMKGETDFFKAINEIDTILVSMKEYEEEERLRRTQMFIESGVKEGEGEQEEEI